MVREELVTLPHPFEPDIEIRRQLGDTNFTRITSLLFNCSIPPVPIGCPHNVTKYTGIGNFSGSKGSLFTVKYSSFLKQKQMSPLSLPPPHLPMEILEHMV